MSLQLGRTFGAQAEQAPLNRDIREFGDGLTL